MSSLTFLRSSSLPHLHKLQRLLDDYQRQAADTAIPLRLAIEERLAAWSFSSASVDTVVHAAQARFPVLRRPGCVLHALHDSQARARLLLRQELDGLDLSSVWNGLWEVLAEAALYLGDGRAVAHPVPLRQAGPPGAGAQCAGRSRPAV